MDKSESKMGDVPATDAPITPLDRAWKAYAERDLDQAAQACESLRAENPSDLEVAYLAGLVYKARGEADKAHQALQVVIDHHASLEDTTRGRMLRRLAVGHLNQIDRGAWDLEPETWERR